MTRIITTVALDLEGTLISTAVSQIPRPGLHAFLDALHEWVPRVVIFTAVREPAFRQIAARLVLDGYAPQWFADIEYVCWSGEVKDLRFIQGVAPMSVLIVDDLDAYIHQDQIAQLVRIAPFEPPYSADDTALADALCRICAAL